MRLPNWMRTVLFYASHAAILYGMLTLQDRFLMQRYVYENAVSEETSAPMDFGLLASMSKPVVPQINPVVAQALVEGRGGGVGLVPEEGFQRPEIVLSQSDIDLANQFLTGMGLTSEDIADFTSEEIAVLVQHLHRRARLAEAEAGQEDNEFQNAAEGEPVKGERD